MLRSDLCDYSDALIVLRRTRNLKTVAPISKINNAFINNAEKLDIFMLMQSVRV